MLLLRASNYGLTSSPRSVWEIHQSENRTQVIWIQPTFWMISCFMTGRRAVEL